MTIWKEKLALAELTFTGSFCCPFFQFSPHLDDERAEDDGAEDNVVEDTVKDIPLTMDLAGIDFIKELHQHKGVEDDGVVFRGRRMERGVTAAVYVEQLLTWEKE